LFQLQAVVEAPHLQEECQFPCNITGYEDFRWIQLSGDMTHQELEFVFVQLLQYNDLEASGDEKATLNEVLEAESLIIPGGLRAILGDQSISPSCCCELETWREWQDFLTIGKSPWLGHDPSPWIEQKGDHIRIWADGGMGGSAMDALHINVSTLAYQEALSTVEQELQAFLHCMETWAQDRGFEQPTRLCQKIGQCFKVSKIKSKNIYN
jgi:hypothetical protein